MERFHRWFDRLEPRPRFIAAIGIFLVGALPVSLGFAMMVFSRSDFVRVGFAATSFIVGLLCVVFGLGAVSFLTLSRLNYQQKNRS